jgi:hypothetical protein
MLGGDAVMVEELEQHRLAYVVVMEVLPESVWISHEDESNPDWNLPAIDMPIPVLALPLGCKVCGDQLADVPLTEKCRDLHDRCRCGARYDEPKAPGCRRRKHPKEEK